MRSDWRDAIIYQIYPRSFKDSNGDGIGDIQGIIEKIPYLKDLGVNAVWISPMYQSPMVDFGYDVADHCAIEPMFGTMKDFDELVKEFHKNNIKLIMDYIPNHTSDQHPWFLESKSSKNNPKRDWYIWADPKPDGSPPNNWTSIFGPTRWELDKKAGQYYLHTFLKEQPDLNWHNPEVEKAMFEVMRFWLEKGVDGFRFDAFELVYKDAKLRDNPPNPNYIPYRQEPEHHKYLEKYTFLMPELFALIKRIQKVHREYGDIIMINETWRLRLHNVQRFYKAGSPLHMPFNIEFVFMDWDAKKRKHFIDQYDRLVGPDYLPNYVLGNHDLPRVASRYGTMAARSAAVLQLTLRGVPTIYNGEELGMEQVEIPPDRIVDPFELNNPGKGYGRDPMRTPMEWDHNDEHAGFSKKSPWLPVRQDRKIRCVDFQQKDPHSFLNLYRKLIKLHTTSEVLIHGSYRSHEIHNDDVFCYERSHNGNKILVLINFSTKPQIIPLPGKYARILLDTNLKRVDENVGTTVSLKPEEGLIIV